ncbi:MAG: LptE family protein [Bacteroidota bacterium]
MGFFKVKQRPYYSRRRITNAGYLILNIVMALALNGCYSFNGASVPPHLKTIAIPLFDDQSGSGEPGLREKITNSLVDRFNRDNNLQVADKTHSDSILEGVINAMPDAPAVVTAGENVTKRRITVNVTVKFQDMKLKKKVWEKQFSNFGDYQAGSDISLRTAAIDAAISKITEDIVLETVSGW